MKKKPSDLARTGGGGSVRGPARDEVTGVVVDPTRPLVWRQPTPLVPHFELRQGEAVFGGMESSLATAFDASGECLGRTLELRLERSFLGRILVETAGALEQEGPVYQGLFWGRGQVTTTSQECLRWRHAFTAPYSHLLIDSRGVELLKIRPAFLRFARTETTVSVTATAWGRSDVAELLLLTWFLRAHIEARGRRVFRRSGKREAGELL